MAPRTLVGLALLAACAPAARGGDPPFQVPPPAADKPEPAPLDPPRSVDVGEILLTDTDAPTPDADVRGQLLAMAQGARACWGSRPARVSLSIVVGVGGSVVDARVLGGDPRTAGCLHDALIGWRFPEASGSRVAATLAYAPAPRSP